jgi:type II secretory pathway component GspD/PulD (secretin)
LRGAPCAPSLHDRWHRDILPPQVRIDAVIADVTLTDQRLLQGATNVPARAEAANGGITAALFSGKGIKQILGALQQITQVDVLASPDLLVADNQTAQLMVGAAVPYLSQTSQSTLTSHAPIVNSAQYQQTGVIMDLTEHGNTGGLVILDINGGVRRFNDIPILHFFVLQQYSQRPKTELLVLIAPPVRRRLRLQ